MKPASITAIESNLFDASNLLTDLKARGYTIDQTFGSEGEYTLKGLVEGIKRILSDLRFLTKHVNTFIRLSTSSERSNLASNLQQLKTYLDSSNFSYVISNLEAIKTVLRQYHLRTNKEYFAEFHQQFDLMQIRYSEVKELQTAVETDAETIEKLKNRIEDSNTSIEQSLQFYDENIEVLKGKIKALEETTKEAESTLENIEEIQEKASSSLSKIDAHKTTILDFLNKITLREKELDKQNSLSKEYDVKLQSYNKERINILDEAKQLIESAKKALEYKTAEGMSAAFTEKHNASVKGRVLTWWAVGAIVSVIAALVIGIFFLVIREHDLYSLIGRISMMSLCVLSATFCSAQYNKQKNLIEDYAYKTVLSKSFIAFAEELKKHGDDAYGSMVRNILTEILQDPLRQREKAKELNISSLNPKELEMIANTISKIKPVTGNA